MTTVPPPRDPAHPYRICAVCLGNICRSPTAEVLLRAELATAGLDGKVTVDSAGTGDWHLGEPMHPGTRAELERRGLDGSAHAARQITPSELAGYDLMLAMDARNLANLRRLAGGDPEVTRRMRLMLSFGQGGEEGADVPDPYYGSDEEFAAVFDLLEPAAREVARQLAELLVEGGPGGLPPGG
jgi:protein-tyrosine phosphatase